MVLPVRASDAECCMQKSEAEKSKVVKGPRANNYGVDSNVPLDNPSKCVHMLDVEDLQVCVHASVPLCLSHMPDCYPDLF